MLVTGKMWTLFNRDEFRDFPYKVEDEVRKIEFSTLTLHDGLQRTRSTPVSVFRYEKNGDTESYNYALRHMQRLKTLRHPNILTFFDSYEDGNHLLIVTERVVPLFDYIKNIEGDSIRHEYLSWGLMNVVKAIEFCQRDGKFCHNNVGHNAVFVNKGGEWKLGEFGFAEESRFHQSGSRAKQVNDFARPGKHLKPSDADIMGLAVLIAEMYCRKTLLETPLNYYDQVPDRLKAAVSLIMTSEETPSALEVLQRGREPGNFFQNEFIDKMLFLEALHTKTPEERSTFFEDFHQYIGKIPDNIAKFKILPQLAMAYDVGCEGVHLIPTLLEFFKSPEPCIQLVDFIGKLFKSNSRATRKMLLEHTDKYINKIPHRVINDVIFPYLASGFRDSSPVIRLETIKSVQHYVTKLHNNRINRELLPLLAGRLVDETKGNIRRAAVATIGDIAPYIDPTNRKNVLLTVYTKAMKDADPATRGTAVKYLLISQENFTPEDMSKKILPALCGMTLDRDESVRNNVFVVLRELLAKLEDIEFPVECNEQPKPLVQKTWTDWMIAALPTKLSNIFVENEADGKGRNTAVDSEDYHQSSENIQIQDPEHIQTEQLETPTDEEASKRSVLDKNCGDQLNGISDEMENERKQEAERAANKKIANPSRRSRRLPKRLATRINQNDRCSL